MDNDTKQGLIKGGVIAIAIVGGMVLLATYDPSGANNTHPSDIRTTVPSRKILTVEEAETYIGRTLRDFCARYGDYENIHPSQFSTQGGGGGVQCDSVGKGYWFDDYIVEQAYYYYDEQSKVEYDKNQEACRKKDPYCDDAPSVYIDTIPEDEARAEGIIIKQ